MDAVVLLGGEGTRLRPLTYDTPKQMLPIVDRALIVHVASWLGRNGVRRAVLSLCYRPDAFTDAFPRFAINGVELTYVVEPEPLDTAGAVRFAAEQGGVDGRFAVLNGDVLTDLDLGCLVAFHLEHEAQASIHLTPVEDPSSFGVVVTDGDDRVTRFVEKPPSGTALGNLINGGTYLMEQSVLEAIPPGGRVSMERETFPLIANRRRLFAMATNDYWLDTGTPEKYLQAQLDILRGLRTAASRPLADERAPGEFVADGGTVEGRLSGVGYVGPGAAVRAGALVTDSVVGARAEVLPGATVLRSAVLPGAVVGEGCIVTDSVVGPGTVLGPGARVEAVSVVRGGVNVPPGAVLRGARYPW